MGPNTKNCSIKNFMKLLIPDHLPPILALAAVCCAVINPFSKFHNICIEIITKKEINIKNSRFKLKYWRKLSLIPLSKIIETKLPNKRYKIAYLDKNASARVVPNNKKYILILLFLSILSKRLNMKILNEVKNNNGTSVLIKPDDKLTPGINSQIKAAINIVNLFLLEVKLYVVKPINKAVNECKNGELILIHNSVSPHTKVNILIIHANIGGLE